MDLESEEEENENGESQENDVEEDENDGKNTSHCMEELWDGGKTFPAQLKYLIIPVLEGVQLPPEPRGECSKELQVGCYNYQYV